MKVPIHLTRWIDENRDAFKPPVGNKLLCASDDYIIMAVGGPNQRHDYHVNQSEEIFYQIKGDLQLNIIDVGSKKSVSVREGEFYLLPGNVPHSPQRPAGTVGIVIEKVRKPDTLDGFEWYCQHCDAKLYETWVPITDIVQQLPAIFAGFYENTEHSTCKRCGVVASPSPVSHKE